MSGLDEVKAKLEEWEREKVLKLLNKAPERKKEFTTLSGIPVKRLYTPIDVKAEYLRDLGFPGEYPYTRGIYPTMYRGRIWTMRQYAGYGTAEETNQRFKFLLKEGQTGLSVAFDLPTQLGYDPDHPLSAGEVGRVGVSIATLRDMEALFNGIPLDKVTTSMTINATCPTVLAMYVAVAEKQGIPPKALGGTVQNDILKEYVARGNYIYPPEPSMKLVVDVIEYCVKEMPRWNPISVSGYHMREAGATAVQEVAFTLSSGIAYVEACIKRGLDVDSFAPRISFFFGAHNDLFEEVCKFRAARRLWARIMKERFDAKNPDSCRLRFHVQTDGVTLTAQQPLNNIVRVTLQALAATLGGAQSVHTNSFDEALCLPTEEAVRVALRTQQIIAFESNVTNTVDPLGGSYYVEWLTDEIESRAESYIKRIDSMGGMVKAVENGYVQREIADSAYKYQKAVENNELVVVGVNAFTIEEKPPLKLLRVRPEVEEAQRMRLAKVKAERDQQRVKSALLKLSEAARSDENVMAAVLECVKAYVTLQEISDALREVYGEYKAPTIY
ncbi:MAG: methylmalonyl-CoA mutase family protein [Candidatus Nezhaarchaeales archaeon]